MKKLFILIGILGFAGTVFALPTTSYQQNVYPFLTSAYDLGTSTNAWSGGTFNKLCLTADSCITSWPTGSGGSSFSWPFTKKASGAQATTTVMEFVGGFLSDASSTIGNGTQSGGLTISGGATTTGNSYFAGNVGIGTQPSGTFTVKGSTSDSSATDFNIVNSLGANLLSVRNDSVTSLGSGSQNTQFSISGSGALAGIYSPAYNSPSNNLIKFKDWNGNIRMYLDMSSGVDGKLGINTITPNYSLEVSGTASTTNFFATSATTTNATSTTFATGTLCLTSDTCRTTWPSGSSFAFPFTKQASGAQATTTVIEFIGGLLSDASSTLTTFNFTNATGTNLALTSLSKDSLLSTNSLGGLVSTSTIGNNQLQNKTISGVALGSNLFAHTHDSSLTGTSYNGSAAVSDWGLDLTHANTWTGLQNFSNATSTLFSSQYASTTILCVSNDCRTAWPTTSMTFQWPFTKQAGGEQSTTTVIGLYNGFLSLASSTVNSSLLVAGSTTLQAFTAIQGTITSATSTNDYSTHYLALGTSTLQNFTAQASIFANATGTNSLATVANFITVGAAATPAYVSSTTLASFNIASSTIVNGASFNRASTTINLAPWLETRQVIGASCVATSSAANPGGVIFRLGGKTNTTAGLYCDAIPRTYTFTAVQVAAFNDFLNLTLSAASNTPDRVSINAITQKIGP